MYAVCARFPHNLSSQVPWQQRHTGVYDCHWGMDTVRVVVSGQLPQEAHNAPLHLFSASPELVGYGRNTYRQHSERTSGMLRQLFQKYQGEDLVMPYTWADFDRDYIKEHLPELTPEARGEILRSLPAEARRAMLASLSLEERREILASLPPEQRRELLASLPPEERLAGLSDEQIRQYLEQLTANRAAKPRKQRRKR